MSKTPSFNAAFPYQDDVLALPVLDISAASNWYCHHFGMTEVERKSEPIPAVLLERDGTRLGFAINGADASQDGAAILVSDIVGIKRELETRGLVIGDCRTDDRDGKSCTVFFVIAPDGLCFYFHEPIVE